HSAASRKGSEPSVLSYASPEFSSYCDFDHTAWPARNPYCGASSSRRRRERDPACRLAISLPLLLRSNLAMTPQRYIASSTFTTLMQSEIIISRPPSPPRQEFFSQSPRARGNKKHG